MNELNSGNAVPELPDEIYALQSVVSNTCTALQNRSGTFAEVDAACEVLLGGTVCLADPKAIEYVTNEAAQAEQRLAGLDELEVLIADDSKVARRRIEQTLTDLGFTRFTHAVDGAEAVDHLAEQTFDLVVTDYNMPRMNGHELIEHIRQQSDQSDVPIVMVTTEYDPMKLGPVYALGVSAICNKSFDAEMVRNIVIRLFQ